MSSTGGAQARLLPDGRRLHLHHGPIDLVIDAAGPGRLAALSAAQVRFAQVLEELVPELPLLRRPPGGERPRGPIARRMFAATLAHAAHGFVTPMAAVAGAVADDILATMRAAGALDRMHVNNGGDIALWLAEGQRFRIGMAGLDGTRLGLVTLGAQSGIGGIATSGLGGRSLTMGIATSVTVLAGSAAAADVAATLIASATDLPGHPAIHRVPACEIDPDSDLGTRAVVTSCGRLTADETDTALGRGLGEARRMRADGLIAGAALTLQGETRTLALPLTQAEERLLHDA